MFTLVSHRSTFPSWAVWARVNSLWEQSRGSSRKQTDQPHKEFKPGLNDETREKCTEIKQWINQWIFMPSKRLLHKEWKPMNAWNSTDTWCALSQSVILHTTNTPLIHTHTLTILCNMLLIKVFFFLFPLQVPCVVEMYCFIMSLHSLFNHLFP